MKFLGGTDNNYKEHSPYFIGCYIDNRLVGVNSLHLTESDSARSRGLWVDPKHRKKGIGKALLDMTAQQAAELGASTVWSYPRKTSINAYRHVGYFQVSEWIDDNEYGKNCFAIQIINEDRINHDLHNRILRLINNIHPTRMRES
jgi:N-acetylglutamate synthase-like GNAT family acetyltransferase